MGNAPYYAHTRTHTYTITREKVYQLWILLLFLPISHSFQKLWLVTFTVIIESCKNFGLFHYAKTFHYAEERERERERWKVRGNAGRQAQIYSIRALSKTVPILCNANEYHII